MLGKLDYYLAGGTALALQIGHRQSVDFDFFSQRSAIGGATEAWLEPWPGVRFREIDSHTVHAELYKVKLSFIGNYKYRLVKTPVTMGKIKLASITDIGLMKLLAITHRATLRDYIDLAAIIRDHVGLDTLLFSSRRKYGVSFNPMIPLRALISFEDIGDEAPMLIDKSLKNSWKNILRYAVRKSAGLFS